MLTLHKNQKGLSHREQVSIPGKCLSVRAEEGVEIFFLLYWLRFIHTLFKIIQTNGGFIEYKKINVIIIVSVLRT